MKCRSRLYSHNACLKSMSRTVTIAKFDILSLLQRNTLYRCQSKWSMKVGQCHQYSICLKSVPITVTIH